MVKAVSTHVLPLFSGILTNNDAAVMIILTDQIFLMPNDQNREMPLRSTVSYFFTRLLQSRLFPREDFFNGYPVMLQQCRVKNGESLIFKKAAKKSMIIILILINFDT